MIATGSLSGDGIGNSVIAPLGVIRPILLPASSVNQTLPSGPGSHPAGSVSPVILAENSVTTCVVGLIRATLPACRRARCAR